MPADVSHLIPSPVHRATRRQLRPRLDVDAIEQAWRLGVIGYTSASDPGGATKGRAPGGRWLRGIRVPQKYPPKSQIV